MLKKTIAFNYLKIRSFYEKCIKLFFLEVYHFSGQLVLSKTNTVSNSFIKLFISSIGIKSVESLY